MPSYMQEGHETQGCSNQDVMKGKMGTHPVFFSGGGLCQIRTVSIRQMIVCPGRALPVVTSRFLDSNDQLRLD